MHVPAGQSTPTSGLAWHHHSPLERTWRGSAGKPRRSAACWAPTHPLVWVHGAHVHGGGLHAQGVAIVPASQLRSGLGYDRLLSDADVELLATTAWIRLHPAA
jgi:hypothetical protein